MRLSVEQIVYTSFSNIGFQFVVSPSIPLEIKKAFRQNIVEKYWNSYNPPGQRYRAAYLQQLSLEKTLFGWLYNDGRDDLGRAHIPYFICYFLVGRLRLEQLELIWNCLEVGPIMMIDRNNPPIKLQSLLITDNIHYQSARSGVCIHKNIRQQSQKTLQQKQAISQFIESESPR